MFCTCFILSNIFLKGRSIVVDWAIPKNKYETIHNPKEENSAVKEELVIDSIEKKQEIKQEVLLDDDQVVKEPSKTIEDYLALEITKPEDDNLVDFENTDFE